MCPLLCCEDVPWKRLLTKLAFKIMQIPLKVVDFDLHAISTMGTHLVNFLLHRFNLQLTLLSIKASLVNFTLLLESCYFFRLLDKTAVQVECCQE